MTRVKRGSISSISEAHYLVKSKLDVFNVIQKRPWWVETPLVFCR